MAEVGDRRLQGHNPILIMINVQLIVNRKGAFSRETCQFSSNHKKSTFCCKFENMHSLKALGDFCGLRKSANFCHPVFVSRCSSNFINDSFLWKESLLTFYIMTCIQSFWKGVWRFIRKTSLALKESWYVPLWIKRCFINLKKKKSPGTFLVSFEWIIEKKEAT